MSPILVRPVREQLEHDRIIRMLQARLRRRYDVALNIGHELTTPVKIGIGTFYPDLVLTSGPRGRKLEGVVEVETGESINHLEAMAQWVPLGKSRAPFYLYVPSSSAEMARRLALENQVELAELWTYHIVADQVRFTMIYRRPATRTVVRRQASTGTSRTTTASRRKTTARPSSSRAVRSASTARGRKTASTRAQKRK